MTDEVATPLKEAAPAWDEVGVVGDRQFVERWAEAVRVNDLETVEELAHPDIEARYPQSREVIRGRDNHLAMLSNFPSGLPQADMADPRGEEAVHVAQSFGMPIITVIGSGDTFFLEGVVQYADGASSTGSRWSRCGKASSRRRFSYWAAPFDPPEWRRPFVEA